MEQQQPPLDQPQMTTLAGRPVKILYAPHGDILIAARTANGEDVYVPVAALIKILTEKLSEQARVQGGIRL